MTLAYVVRMLVVLTGFDDLVFQLKYTFLIKSIT